MIRRVLETAGTGLVLAGAVFGCFAQTQPAQSSSRQVSSPTTASRLTATETAQARAWDLTETEWRRYKTLMQGIRGRLSPDLPPVETLGIHARTRQERERYAELWVKALRQDTERVLAFQRAYDAAWRRLHGDEPLIDLAQPPDPPSSTLLQAGDRVLFFTGADCASCGATLAILLARVRQVADLGLDVHLVGSERDDAAVRAWARARQLPSELVRSRRVTLNHDNGTLARLSRFTGTVPYVVRRRGEQLVQLDPDLPAAR